MKRVVLAGGTGFLGQLLAEHLNEHGWEPVILTRHPSPQAEFREVKWDAKSAGNWVRELEGADAVINLAGRSVNCRFTPENKRLVMDSRVDSTRAIGTAIMDCAQPPKAWLNCSTATIYRHTFGAPHDESSVDYSVPPEAKDEYSVEVARAWEDAMNDSPTPHTRKVALRITLVFGTIPGGVFQIMRKLAKLGLGGRMGSGRQFVSWIHEHDFARAVEWVLDHPELSGPINMAAPNPLTNADLMKTFRNVCGIPIGLPAYEWMLEVGAAIMRTETELILKSRNVIPGKLLKSGFEFRYPRMEDALRELELRMK